jgi:hypothetical protein
MLLAVLAGYAVVTVVVMAGTAAAGIAVGLRSGGPPTTPSLALNVAVSFLGAVCAGYVSARLAPTGRAVMTMGLLILLFLAMAVVSSRFSSETHQPPSYLPLVTLLGVIGVWTGGMIERAMHASSF